MQYYYSIYDATKSILEPNKEFPADSPSKAIKAYLKEINEPYNTIKVDGSNYARLKAEPFYIRDGVKYYARNKKSMWFSVS